VHHVGFFIEYIELHGKQKIKKKDFEEILTAKKFKNLQLNKLKL